MSFSQLKDALHWIADYQRDLKEQYQKLAQDAPETKVGAILQYLGDHAGETETGLRRYLETAPAEMLETWSRTTPELPQIPQLEKSKCCLCSSTVKEVTEMALRIHTAKDSMYQTLEEFSELQSQRELLRTLREAEAAEIRRVVRDIARFES